MIGFHLGSHSFSGVERLEVNGLPNSITGNWNLWAQLDQRRAFQTIAHETIASGHISTALWGEGGRMNLGLRVDPAYAVHADAGSVFDDTLNGGAGSDVLRDGLGDDMFLYSTRSGKLYFDPDGDGVATAVLIATLAGAPALAASDIRLGSQEDFTL